jgi:hypothetical protein
MDLENRSSCDFLISCYVGVYILYPRDKGLAPSQVTSTNSKKPECMNIARMLYKSTGKARVMKAIGVQNAANSLQCGGPGSYILEPTFGLLSSSSSSPASYFCFYSRYRILCLEFAVTFLLLSKWVRSIVGMFKCILYDNHPPSTLFTTAKDFQISVLRFRRVSPTHAIVLWLPTNFFTCFHGWVWVIFILP